jgi:hypothetical protein
MPDDHAELNHFLAEKVMGFEASKTFSTFPSRFCSTCGISYPNNLKVLGFFWDPAESIEQAIEVAKTFEKWSVASWRDIYRCYLHHNGEFIAEHAETPALAICRAARRAVEG